MLILNLISQPVNILDKILFFVYFIMALIIGITIHEFAHAWTAYRLGDPTPKIMKRLTLNPLAHLDPLGTIFLFIVGFGWGKPVPFNPDNFKNEKEAVLLTSFSGAIANLLMALVFSIPYRLNIYFHLGLDKYWFFALFEIIVEINLVLAAFNILPIPPLDGSKLFYLIFNREQMMKFERFGPIILFALVILSFTSGYNFLGYYLMYVVGWLQYLVQIFPARPM